MTKVTITYERESKLPEWATPSFLAKLQKDGKTLRELGNMAGVSYETIRREILKAKADK